MSEEKRILNLKNLKRQKIKQILNKHSIIKNMIREISDYKIIKDELEV